MDLGIFLDHKLGDVAGNLSTQRGVVGADIGIIGRNHEAARRHIAPIEPAGGSKHQRGRCAHQDALAVRFEGTDARPLVGADIRALRQGASAFDLIGDDRSRLGHICSGLTCLNNLRVRPGTSSRIA